MTRCIYYKCEKSEEFKVWVSTSPIIFLITKDRVILWDLSHYIYPLYTVEISSVSKKLLIGWNSRDWTSEGTHKSSALRFWMKNNVRVVRLLNVQYIDSIQWSFLLVAQQVVSYPSWGSNKWVVLDHRCGETHT
jgi:hypothetical protein